MTALSLGQAPATWRSQLDGQFPVGRSATLYVFDQINQYRCSRENRC